MASGVGDTVHPWYKGIHEWTVKKVATLKKPVEWEDKEQGHVKYEPKIMKLESPSLGEVLWFPYWLSTNNTQGKFKWGQRPPMLEESVLFELIQEAIRQDMFSQKFLRNLKEEILKKLD